LLINCIGEDKLVVTRQQLENSTLGELADRIASGRVGTVEASAELERRRTVFQQQAAEAQERATIAQQEAADAAKETARYTQQNACYMLWSVIVLAIASAVTALFSVWDYFFN
jgi:hypothetical protein